MSGGKWDLRGIVWWLPGLAVLLAGALLYSPFGVSLSAGRVVVAVAMVALGASAAWRWWWARPVPAEPEAGTLTPVRKPDPPADARTRRLARLSRALAAEALVAAGFAVVGVAAVSMPVSLAFVWAGAFFVALGTCELVVGAHRDEVLVSSTALAGWQVLAGSVLATLPYRTGLDFTAWTILALLVTGVAMVVRGVRLTAPLPRASTLRWWRPVSVGVQLIVLAGALGWYGTIVTQAARQQDEQGRLAAFYAVPQGLSPAAPGTVIRSSPLPLPGVRGQGWRLLYWSQDGQGRPTVSSGVVIAPLGPAANRPILNYTHGTVSLGADCAPSRQADFASTMRPWLDGALERGWVVAASDYAGAAGTGDGEHYLVTADQGRDAVNAARAARNLPGTGAGTDMVIYGVSQGGLISLAAAALTPGYAPELHLVADAANAAASDIAGILQARPPQLVNGWAVVPFLTTQFPKAYPNLDPNALLTPQAALRNREIAAAGCAATPFSALLPRLTALPGLGDYFKGDPLADPAWRKAFEENRAPDMPPGIPVYLAHGLDDELVPAKFTAALAQRYCAAGIDVTTQWNPGVGHDNDNEMAVAPKVLDWFSARLAGQSPPGTCGRPLPAGLAEH
ncbi:hypothetical protein NBRGN_006_00210 [Nocardia brasiliensis NBRC 14402]|uniref:lipase family protein n=1 Tax=Nocardia brasiliensis TaxID=37326 RepID=UPI000317148E|nr:lipase family protein [Nocardia brasiliensis]ASF11811.1 hypothetical protein CEQ30_35730 [Nocardia brasiliensis]GAJ79281.1 hypothetical protein NBRGN_006_00210 [Nocardia brasiliensis NBRC 14402]SUB09356.1 Predicted esterase [Nocardia brasiliensis]